MALENVITSLVLDVIDHDQTQGVVKAIALDSKTRYVKATVVQHGIDYPVDENATVTLTILRPDNVGVQVTGSVVDVDNADRTGTIKGVYAEMSQAALAVSGTLKAQFKVTSGEQILRTEIFLVKNGVALDGETDTWADQYEGYNLDELVTNLNSAVAEVNTLEGRVDALEQGGGGTRTLPADFIELLQTILNEAVYGSDQSDNIDDLGNFSNNEHYYSITKTLSHCSSSNSDDSTLGGSSYSTTITADEGYTLTTVTCTMGGVSQTVTNGVVTIAEVTGDIVITATAEIHEENLLYKLSETTTFDGTNTIDTGVAIEGNYNSDNTLEFTIVCTTTCTDTGDKYPFSVYSTAQSGTGLYVDLSGKANVYAKWFSQSKNTSFAWVNADVLRIVYRKKSGEYPTVSFTKNGDTANTKTLTFTSTANNAVIASADHVIIGCSPSGAGKLKGTMSDFRVYDRAYSDAELTSYLGGE